jgi:hypothetical protein
MGKPSRAKTQKHLDEILAVPEIERDFADRFLVHYLSDLLAATGPALSKMIQRRAGARGKIFSK